MSTADFVPKRREVSNVTNDVQAIVTTTEDHEYDEVTFIRMHVVFPNTMILDTVKGRILEIIDATNFKTNIDTSKQFPFNEATFPPPFTGSHVVPIDGDTDNIAGPLV